MLDSDCFIELGMGEKRDELMHNEASMEQHRKHQLCLDLNYVLGKYLNFKRNFDFAFKHTYESFIGQTISLTVLH